jgi:PST family polysaccharide transporter
MESGGTSFAKATIRGTFWSYLSVYTGKLLVFISTIILARLLSKADFGVVGYAFIVTSFLDALNGLGIGPALIYHKDEPETADTAFWLGLAVGIGLFAVTWLAAPLIGAYFNDERAIPVVRMMVLVYPISALGNVNAIYLAKKLDFRKNSSLKSVTPLPKASPRWGWRRWASDTGRSFGGR